MDEGDFEAGHEWVYAPPFFVVDLTLKQQQREQRELQYFPDFMVSEEGLVKAADIKDIVSPDILLALIMRGIPRNQLLAAINPTMERFVNTFETYSIQAEQTVLKYVPVATGAPECPLEEMFGISMEGRSAIEIYNDLVLPELNRIRV